LNFIEFFASRNSSLGTKTWNYRVFKLKFFFTLIITISEVVLLASKKQPAYLKTAHLTKKYEKVSILLDLDLEGVLIIP
jgi:hypothetical protein